MPCCYFLYWYLEAYLRSSLSLADLNNKAAAERKLRYRHNLASLHRLVLFQFDNDEMGE